MSNASPPPPDAWYYFDHSGVLHDRRYLSPDTYRIDGASIDILEEDGCTADSYDLHTLESVNQVIQLIAET